MVGIERSTQEAWNIPDDLWDDSDVSAVDRAQAEGPDDRWDFSDVPPESAKGRSSAAHASRLSLALAPFYLLFLVLFLVALLLFLAVRPFSNDPD